ncbi:type 4a pilus biogenesis protein PilO [Solemya velum gill symbiont]|uniref:Tfp pilus assembly protein PilO n=1 Tax=Solemya velum gill symbiont TaxID=2340 RepID=A0A0B0HGN4_SOVGS|nr:type 4a pilus biogenesis protein PilO [Solemya velum gill symbiont]KHF26641.1 Tfp pilus assembly protein PilO [Solemya velum gill symbiont]OOY53985.1 pilus assembly protein PilO [Solemya velum gill symbiont]OOY57785.1 pilus assembly protein PilO [Solemya velum gill symbiont]OOY58809.1 pilus assembly protein PilO [Solemya velum gill symbiont]OOY61446.1 pilus assembly protein PilO [Solemya velum gill symbiont]
MNLSDINDLDFSRIGEWPVVAKSFVVLVLCAAIAGGWYYYDIMEQQAEHERLRKVEMELRAQFESKQAKAINLEVHRQQLEDMRRAFGVMLMQLPEKSEVANLLIDVSQAGLLAGLEFELFQPAKEVAREFYTELPVKLRVIGDYHEFGEFVSTLASMPRILTVHDVKIYRINDSLRMDAVAKTYYYTEDEAFSPKEGGK